MEVSEAILPVWAGCGWTPLGSLMYLQSAGRLARGWLVQVGWLWHLGSLLHCLPSSQRITRTYSHAHIRVPRVPECRQHAWGICSRWHMAFATFYWPKQITGPTQNQEVGKQTLPNMGKVAKYFGHVCNFPLQGSSIPYVHECIKCSQAYLRFWSTRHYWLTELEVS